MSSNGGTSDDTSPLLNHRDGGMRNDQGGWWNKFVDMEEVKTQILFSLPMILTNVCYYFIPLVSVMFTGHLGDLEFAGSNLANSWTTVTGIAFMVGLSGSLETLCGQGYGAKLYRMMGIHLQASCIISIFFSILISIIWFYSEPILILLHQDPQISKMAALYMKYSIPSIYAYGILQNILRFLQTQSVVMPLFVCSLVPLMVHIGIAYGLVHWTSLGFRGAALGVSISLWFSVILLGLYVLYAKKFEHTWFSLESFYYIFTNLKLALLSATMVCLEYWAIEILVLLAGLMPNTEITTSLIAMCVNTESVAFMITYGMSATASTRVSNELGAGNPDEAKKAMAVTLKISVPLAVTVVLALAFGHNIWAGFFSNSSVIINKYASMTPLLVVSVLFDSFQGVLSGVVRGCGLQHWAVYINLGTFYLIGMPISIFLGFYLKLHAKGLWIGLICGLTCQTGALLLLTRFSKWTRVEISDNSNRENPVVV